MNNKVLCVDDDPNILAAYQRNLRKRFSIDTATSGDDALAMMKENGNYAVLVVDMQMPKMDGIQFLQQAQQVAPDSVRLMLTGNADQLTAMRAVNQGHVFQFLTKPCSNETLAMALESAIKQHRLITAEKEILERTLNGTIKILMDILSTLDPQSFRHSMLLRDYMRGFAQAFKASDLWALEMAAMLCPVGYVTVPPLVIRKARSGLSLSGEEKDMLVRVPQIGSELLATIPRLEGVSKTVLYQDKRYDGTGFPNDEIAGEAIPIGARIVKVLYDLIRIEEGGVSRPKALAELQARHGWYDPRVLDAVIAFFENYFEQSAVAASNRREIPVKELRVGSILGMDVKTREGVLIVTAGTKVTPFLLERLRNFAQIGGLSHPVVVEA